MSEKPFKTQRRYPASQKKRINLNLTKTCECMYEASEAFHKQYADMYDKCVRIHFKDGSMRVGFFNDEFYEDSSILVSCEVIKIAEIGKMELLEAQA